MSKIDLVVYQATIKPASKLDGIILEDIQGFDVVDLLHQLDEDDLYTLLVNFPDEGMMTNFIINNYINLLNKEDDEEK